MKYEHWEFKGEVELPEGVTLAEFLINSLAANGIASDLQVRSLN